MPVLNLPDILGAMKDFELRTHPNEDEVSQATNEWFKSYNMMPEHLWNKFVKCKFGLLTGMAYPDTDSSRLRVTSDYMSILFAYDDLMDLPSSDLMHDKIGADKAAKVMMSVLKNPDDFRPVSGMPVATAFHDWWLRYCATSTPGMQKRFIDSTWEYVLAARNQVGNRQSRICPTIEEYVALRRDTSAIKTTYACVEYCIGQDVPDEAFNHPTLLAIQEAGNDILAWANDIYSFDNENACGDHHNLVAVVSIQKGIAVQEAMDFAFEMVKSAIKRFFYEIDQLPSFGAIVDPIVRAYVKGVEVYISGSVFWHLACERYFGPNFEQVKQSLTFSTKALEAGAKPEFVLVFDKHPDPNYMPKSALAQTFPESVFNPSGSAVGIVVDPAAAS